MCSTITHLVTFEDIHCFEGKKIEHDLDSAKYLGYQFWHKPYISVGIKVDRPTELRMYTTKRGISKQKLSRAKSRGDVQEDEDYPDGVFASRSLSDVYSESDPHKQKEKIEAYVKEMHQTLKVLRNK